MTDVQNDAYIKKTSSRSTGHVTVVVTLWASLCEGRLRISDEAVAVLVVILYKFRESNLISSRMFSFYSFRIRYL
jgi:hypothetical protein